jgi:excisionase family DNA binding protein
MSSTGDGAQPGLQLFYTVEECASILRVSKMTIYREIHAQQIPAIKIRSRWVVPGSYVERKVQEGLSARTETDAGDAST